MSLDLSGTAQLITSVVVLATFINSILNTKRLIEVKEQTDGINKTLVKTTGESEFAKGLKKGLDAKN